MSIIVDIREKIKQRGQEAAEAARKAGRLSFAELPPFIIEVPREKNHGDLAANLAMVLARPARMAPRQIAAILIEFFEAQDTWVEKTEIAGPGFINCFLKPDWLYRVPLEVAALAEHYGCREAGHGETVQVEFVSANPTGLLHIGHARGAALGDT